MPRFRIVPERSRLWIDARSNLHAIRHRCEGLEGFVELSMGTDGEIDVRSHTTGRVALPVKRLTSGNPLEDRELRRRIDARRHPVIEGALVQLRPAGTDGQYLVHGDVTFRGVTQRCIDTMTITRVDDRTLTFAGSSRFDIRDFGMSPPRILLLKVEPEVDVRVEIVAERED